jgi:hypothetical protein
MSRLLKFYSGKGTDDAGRYLNDILAWDDDAFEAVHDFIQWLFPLPEPSQFNANAPLLAKSDISAFKSDPALQANLKRSFERILAFLGFALNADGKVAESDRFSARIPDVWASANHNWLRITRILRSLTLVGMEKEAKALYDRLRVYYKAQRFPIPADTFRYWTDALAG